MSNALTSMLDLDQIVSQVVHTVRSEMFVDTAGVIVVDAERKACLTFFVGEAQAPGGALTPGQPVAYDDPLLELVRAERGPAVLAGTTGWLLSYLIAAPEDAPPG